METVTLEQLKRQVNVDPQDSTYDTQLMEIGEEAEAYVLGETGHSCRWFYERFHGIPREIRRAVLLVAGDWFAYREASRPASVGSPEDSLRRLTYKYTLMK